MKLASRCTACGTLFSVVRDQLWVSAGRVRCGHCGVTFNAFDQLYDLQQGKPPPWAAAKDPAAAASDDASALHELAPAAVPEALAEALPDATAPAALETVVAPLPLVPAPDGSAVAAIDSAAAPEKPASPRTDGAGEAAEGTGAGPLHDAETLRVDELEGAPFDAAAARDPVTDAGTAEGVVRLASAESPPVGREANAAAAADEAAPAGNAEAAKPTGLPFEPDAPVPPEQPSSGLGEPASSSAPASLAAPHAVGAPLRPATTSAATPSFIRRAERRAHWSRPGVRIALGVASGVLAATLLLQGALHYRDRLAAHSAPAARMLAWWCARSGCTIGPPRRIADLTVESSVLSRVPGDGGLVRLALTVRNRGSVAAAVPALEMSLTDSGGKVVVRRAVRLSEMAGAPEVLPPNVDVPLQLLLATGGQRIAGFTVELFYP